MRITKTILKEIIKSKKIVINALSEEIKEFPETKTHNTRQINRLDIEINFIENSLL